MIAKSFCGLGNFVVNLYTYIFNLPHKFTVYSKSYLKTNSRVYNAAYLERCKEPLFWQSNMLT